MPSINIFRVRSPLRFSQMGRLVKGVDPENRQKGSIPKFECLALNRLNLDLYGGGSLTVVLKKSVTHGLRAV